MPSSWPTTTARPALTSKAQRPPRLSRHESAAAKQTNAARSLHHQALDVPVTAQHIDTHVLLMADQEQIDGRPSHLEIVNPQLTAGEQALHFAIAGQAFINVPPVVPSRWRGEIAPAPPLT